MTERCTCGCGRQPSPAADRRRQLAWIDAVAQPGSAGVLAERAAAHEALTEHERAVRDFGCFTAAAEVDRWRQRWDLATDRALQLGLLSSGDPDDRRRRLEQLRVDVDISSRRQRLRHMEMTNNAGEVGCMRATPTAGELDVAERAVAFARARLPAHIADQVPKPVTVQWFTHRRHAHEQPLFWASPDTMGWVPDVTGRAMWIRAGLDDEQLARAVAHELYHLGQPRTAGPGHLASKERAAYEFSDVEFLGAWRRNEQRRRPARAPGAPPWRTRAIDADLGGE